LYSKRSKTPTTWNDFLRNAHRTGAVTLEKARLGENTRKAAAMWEEQKKKVQEDHTIRKEKTPTPTANAGERIEMSEAFKNPKKTRETQMRQILKDIGKLVVYSNLHLQDSVLTCHRFPNTSC
jgi:hypothetical protein